MSCFSGMMKTGDKPAILWVLKSRRVPWNSTCEVMHTGSAGQRELSMGGLADKSAGSAQSHKSLNSLPWPTVPSVCSGLLCLGVFQPPDARIRQLSFVCFSSVPSSTFWVSKRAWPEPPGFFGLQTPFITSEWLDAKISEEKGMDLSGRD